MTRSSNYQPPVTLDDLVTLRSNELGQLVAILNDGTEHVDIQPVRAFPLTQPDFGISLVNNDGNEIL